MNATAELPASEAPSSTWLQRAQLPLLTIGVFVALAMCLWLNAIINRYRFNVVVAVLGSVPVVVLLLRGAIKARHGDKL